MKREYKYLFGPVPSRRLGRSLGLDLTPFKTCTLDCIFCQLGRTTHKTLDRREYVPVAAVETELTAWIKAGGQADHITLAGSGEPTLHSRFGDILQSVRARTGIPTALLSNGTLFWQPEVREAANRADIVKLSLSVWDPFSFEHLNRPHPELTLRRILDGYRAFRDGFHGTLWIEVFLVWGVNSAFHDVTRIAELVNAIGADDVHLNTPARPPAEADARAVPHAEMKSRASLFRPAAKVIATFPTHGSSDRAANEETLLTMLSRRPCTAPQIAEGFGMHPNEVSKYLGRLWRAKKIQMQAVGKETYYRAVAHEAADTRRGAWAEAQS